MSLFKTVPRTGDFTSLFRLLDDYDVHRANRGQPSSARLSSPFDVRECSNAYHLDGELPGVSPNDIDIEFSDPQTLVIKGRVERQYHMHGDKETEHHAAHTPPAEEGRGEGGPDSHHRYWVSERSAGEFHRVFSFPTRVDQDSVKASLKNGILSITVAKSGAAAPKKITIE